MRVRDQAHTSGILALVAWLASINLLVLVFNLIPAFPLDGGRVARAIAWKVTGDRNRATRGAARLGQGFSYLFIAIGILFFLRGDLISGIWLGLIGFILGQSARGAVMQTEFTSRIEGIRVADVMDEEPVAIPEDASVERALDEYFLRYRWPWFPVVDPTQRFLGLIERGAADAVPEVSRRPRTVARRLRGRLHRNAAGTRRRAARVAAGQRRPAPAGRPHGGGRRRPSAGRDHRGPGRPGAPPRPLGRRQRAAGRSADGLVTPDSPRAQRTGT